MYGLVNKAIESLVTAEHGEDAWREITRRAGFDEGAFVSMDAYPDDVTYALVGAASHVLEVPVDALLEAFGEYWILYTGREGYGDLLEMSGESFAEFLENLDGLHSRVGLSFPDLTPPAFRCEAQPDGKLRLHYSSQRDGLAPMVIGLVRGLARKFGIGATIEHVVSRGDGADHDEFEIRIQEPQVIS